MRDNQSLLLEVKDLTVSIPTVNGKMTIIDNMNFHLHKGEVLALVGESGCGKSITALSLLRLLPRKSEIRGQILFNGKDLVKASTKEMRAIRGGKISMIFQEPMTSLNPVKRIGSQIVEAIRTHLSINKKKAYELAGEMLDKVGLPDPKAKLKNFPHQLSGGQRQRVMIAMALVCQPDLLIADEPTTALDVTIQAQILDLMRELRRDFNTAMIFISHDLGVVSEIADRIAVMYAGRMVEESKTKQLFKSPTHPYTKGLLHSIPDGKKRGVKLETIVGTVPTPDQFPTGCRFYERCSQAMSVCLNSDPKLKFIHEDTQTACFLYEEQEFATKEDIQ